MKSSALILAISALLALTGCQDRQPDPTVRQAAQLIVDAQKSQDQMFEQLDKAVASGAAGRIK